MNLFESAPAPTPAGTAGFRFGNKTLPLPDPSAPDQKPESSFHFVSRVFVESPPKWPAAGSAHDTANHAEILERQRSEAELAHTVGLGPTSPGSGILSAPWPLTPAIGF